MQLMNTDWQIAQGYAPPFELYKESKLKLSLETRSHGDVMIIHCEGRIVYRDEAAALSRLVGEVLQHARKVVLDLSGVSSIDSAGIGELALLHTSAQSKQIELRYAGPNSLVRSLLDLTNLDSVLQIHPSLEDALGSFRQNEVCADC
jgi:anti-sigma B factor antagonist